MVYKLLKLKIWIGGGKRGGLVLYCAGAEIAFLLPLIMSVPPSVNFRETWEIEGIPGKHIPHLFKDAGLISTDFEGRQIMRRLRRT
jgi:hypothetical protein